MIVGTAGHIDHGKTTLVRALTGVDTDRLPEEKKRGITIELGYAFMDVAPPGHGRIGFVDVPGHERLVHTMLAGATGIDFFLLVVAADDGVMPQTREHLAVLSLLGLSRGAAIITKVDRVDATRRAEVAAEVQALLPAGTPVLQASAHTGEGLPAVKALLQQAAQEVPTRGQPGEGFRLAIDRAFTLAGVGTVVTGTVQAGQVQVGDELALVPGRAGAGLLRVRSLHAQNQPVTRAHAGQRCAVALAGIGKEEIARGQWLVHPAVALATDRLDAEIRLWPGEAKALRSGTPVHVHIGAADVLGTVAVLQQAGGSPGTAEPVPGDTLAPGATALVQLVLRAPLGAWRGDRVVLRDASASRTLAGGRVLDPFAPTRYRRTPQRLAELAAQTAPTAAQRLAAQLAAAPQGVDLGRWQVAEGALPCTVPLAAGALASTDPPFALGAGHAAVLAEAACTALRLFHEQHPDELGPDAARLRRLAAPRLPEPLWRALLQALQAEGRIAQRGAFVHLPAHGVQLNAADQRIAQKVAPLIAAAGFEGAWARDLARDTRESEPLVRTSLARLAQQGALHQVVRDLFYDAATITRLAALARQTGASGQGAVTAAAFRDSTGLGRKRAIQVLEYFDRVGLLRRVGDLHRVRADSHLFEEAAPQ